MEGKQFVSNLIFVWHEHLCESGILFCFVFNSLPDMPVSLLANLFTLTFGL